MGSRACRGLGGIGGLRVWGSMNVGSIGMGSREYGGPGDCGDLESVGFQGRRRFGGQEDVESSFTALLVSISIGRSRGRSSTCSRMAQNFLNFIQFFFENSSKLYVSAPHVGIPSYGNPRSTLDI